MADLVRLDAGALHQLLEAESGPVMRDAVLRGLRVRAAARRKLARVPYSRQRPRGSGLGRGLAESIEVEVDRQGGDTVVVVAARTSYAYFVHEGTRPHEIRASRAPRLVFFWPKAGRVVAFPRVRHPGARAQRYLAEPLAQVMSDL